MRSSAWFVASCALILCTLRLIDGAKGQRQCSEHPTAAIAPVPIAVEMTDYYYEYTECDSTGSRWRVAIPQKPGSCTGLPEPVHGTECTFSCEAGEFLEMTAQECTQCAAGSYSLGSGIRFDQWDTMPAGFSSLATSVENNPSGDDRLSCNSSSWVPQGNYLESNRDECTVSLIYAVHLKKQGSVSFEYQYPDNNLLFEFFIQNDQCQEMDQSADTKWLKLTNHGEWATHTESPTHQSVSHVSQGTFSHVPGSSTCDPCPRDTYSGHGASSCTPCNTTTQYAGEGSVVCKDRPPCSKKDYFQIHTACDHEGKTQIMYKWIEPKICLEESCQQCPAGTEPNLGYEYKWWNILPTNMKTSCFNVGNSKCDNMNGWEVAGDHIQSGSGSSDNDYLILNIHVPGFKLPTSMSGHSVTEFGRITFEFEISCTADCELYFMMDHSLCYSDCHFTYTEGNVSLTYDFSNLGSVGSLMNGPSFTSKGTKYFHQFNISLCGKQGQSAVCTDNVTDLSITDSQREKGEGANGVKTFICQSTIIPASGRGFHTALSSQSINLADTFLGVTVEDTLDKITLRPDLYPKTSKKVPDVNFFYRSLEATSSCESGRSAVVTLRCNPVKSVKGDLSVPSARQEHATAAPSISYGRAQELVLQCTDRDYHQIEGACKGGHQDLLYVWTEPKLCVGGVTLPEKKTLPCEGMEFWVRLGAGLGVFTAVLLVSLTCYFWKKNKRLEYKYSRLVMSANKECEMPGADSCAVMEGENEGDMEDEVVYTKPSLLGKLKAIASKGNGEHYEHVQLNSSHPKALVWS
ncbi:UPF0577 protein KIAA1324-like -like protein [Collichthys lucidus]|uniref:UPF0577 protein KIAA1324-like-like protein n=1 Tax=Collichthys lucidus TaxID=240159 RepID=A0A4U5UIP9_COLLU|nr:UPF0577 protein KIAA1324-like -like protein [Collichthys lucidus]